MKLSTKVSFIVVGGTTVAILVAGFLVFTFNRSELEQSIGASQLELAVQTLDKIDRFLFERYLNVQSIAGEEIFAEVISERGGHEPVEIQDRIKNLMFLTGPWDALFVTNKEGVIFASADEEEIGRLQKDEPLNFEAFQSALSSPNEAYYSDVVISDDTGRPTLIFAYPVRDRQSIGQPVIGVIIGNFSWRVITEILQSVETTSEIRLHTKDGKLIATNQESSPLLFKVHHGFTPLIQEALSYKSPLTKTRVDPEDGHQALLSLAPSSGYLGYRGNNWVLSVETPTAIAFAPAQEHAIQTALFLVPIFLAAFGLVLLFLSRLVVAPITALSRFTKTISAGDLSKRITIQSKDEVGELAASFNTMTERIQESFTSIKAEKEKIEVLVESIGDGVMATDENGKIIIWNKTAERIAGWSRAEALNKHWREILKLVRETDKRDNSGFIDLTMQTKTAKTMENHTVLVRKDGKEIPVEDSAAPILEPEGLVKGVIVVFRDATIERALDRAKEEFVSVASHQLRTPLTAIKGYSGMLLDEDAGKLNEKQRDYIQEIKHGNDRMIDLVTALLNVSRIDLGVFSVEPEPVKVEDLALSVLKELQDEIKDKKLQIKQIFDKDLPTMNVDPKLMRMIFQNLLSNAVKYTQAQGSVLFEVKRQNHDLLITVADNGHGIPKDAQSRIFTKLFRADNARVIDPDGTGLGLYIVKAVVEESGGKIWFESPTFVEKISTDAKALADKSAGKEENKGTAFYVTLPLAGMKARAGAKKLQ